MSTWLKLLPLEIKEVNDLGEPDTEVNIHDHIVGELSNDLRKLYTMWKKTTEVAARTKVDLLFSNSKHKEELDRRFSELSSKSEALREIFWIGVHDEHDLWSKDSVGVRRGWKVVWSDSSSGPNLRDIIGGMFFRR